MKVLQNKYPKGTFKYQKSDGRYIDSLLYENIKKLASKITNDMTFLGICFSSTLEVGAGKSAFMTQLGETWTEIINEMYSLNLKFTKRNIVWRPKELIERSFELPKYSFILLDEWDDDHYWSEMGKTLRQYFRKCRQQNLFIVVIIPNYFQLPLGYAISRSIFAIDIKFDDDLDRGNFEFYDFQSKKNLYIKGKKYHNYKVVPCTFRGVFGDGYGIPKKEYLETKRKDLEKWEKEDVEKLKPETIKKNERLKTLALFFNNKELIKKEGLNSKTISIIFGFSQRQARSYIKETREKFVEAELRKDYINKQWKK